MTDPPAPEQDPEALTAQVIETLVANHRAFLAFLERRLGNRALAEDILQDAFVRGLDRADELRQDDSAVAWFYRVLRNAVIDHHRRRAVADRKLDDLARELEATGHPADDLDRTVCACVAQLAATLRPEYATALRRVDLEGAAVKDYASETGISSSNAGVRVFRARAALRKQVARACGTCAEHGCLDCSCQPPG